MFDNAVEEDQRYLFLEEHVEVIEIPGVVGEGYQKSVDAAVEQCVYAGDLFLYDFLGLTDDEIIAGGVGDFLHAGDNGRHEVAVESRDDDADGVGSLAPEVGGEGVVLIAHFAGCFDDALFCIFS